MKADIPMELNLETVLTPPRPAATVVLLRDAPAGLEVFLMKRHGLSDVLGGAYVFPGGKVDAADAEVDMASHADQPASALHAGLGEAGISETTAAALYVAALREAFEESGVLFAQGGASAQQAAARLREGVGFNAMLAKEALRLQTSAILPWSRWITPVRPSVMNKRFDTRFFVAAVPGAPRRLRNHRKPLAQPARGAAAVLGRPDRAGAAANHEPGAPRAAQRRRQRAGGSACAAAAGDPARIL
jgi:8-oxo-dGTP pyrophosphatase MutT (NUDIX family)